VARLRSIAGAAAVVAVLAAGTTAAGAASGTNTANGVAVAKVAPGSKTDPKGAFFAFEAAPGSTTTQQLLVSNPTHHSINVHVDPVDALTRGDTGVAYGASGKEPAKTGTWVVVSTPVLTLTPNESQTVAFSVQVPEDVHPGVYLAGLSTYVPVDDNATTTQTAANAATLSMKFQPRRIVAVEVTVPGAKAPKLVITGARAEATTGGVALALAIENDGNDYARGSGLVEVSETSLRKQFKIDTFVPGTKIDYLVPWTNDIVPGTHPVSAVLRYGDGQRLDWNGTVNINGSLAKRLSTQLPNHKQAASSGFPVVLLVVGAGVFALCCVAGALLLRRRRPAGPRQRLVLE
jgi:hypothetical protein